MQIHDIIFHLIFIITTYLCCLRGLDSTLTDSLKNEWIIKVKENEEAG